MVRIFASEVEFAEINRLAYLIAVYTNPQLFFDVANDETMNDVLSVKRYDILKKLMEMM